MTEHTAAIPAALIALLAVIHAGSVPHRRRRRVIADVTVMALACAAILAVYNVLSFGGPFSLGYANEIAFEDMSRGFFGITSPRSDIMIELLFGQFRGLFFLAPVLAVAPIGLALLARDPLTRPSAFTGAAILVYYVVLNSSYSYWDGGWSFGPRHMAPVLPLMGLALATVWSRARPAVRAGLCALALYSVGLALVAVSTTAQPPDNVKRPVSELLWPNFVNGRVSTNWQSFVENGLQDQRDPETHAWNVGEELGLTGIASLTPLAAIWAVIIAGYWWARQKANRPPAELSVPQNQNRADRTPEQARVEQSRRPRCRKPVANPHARLWRVLEHTCPAIDESRVLDEWVADDGKEVPRIRVRQEVHHRSWFLGFVPDHGQVPFGLKSLLLGD